MIIKNLAYLLEFINWLTDEEKELPIMANNLEGKFKVVELIDTDCTYDDDVRIADLNLSEDEADDYDVEFGSCAITPLEIIEAFADFSEEEKSLDVYLWDASIDRDRVCRAEVKDKYILLSCC